ncbi:hypothetical protein DSO57_1039690 [Entomophthora muscae]|uniref:Uncharacterized protein n=1 Tax=Entomophthora muscae TaxID=34485 RepID=A0ACC2RF34_9FUNG|nr:hypothetical protein DSO57_1039690 [Entomophthora muscae]
MFLEKYTSQRIHVVVYLGILLHCILKTNIKKLEDVPIQMDICRVALNCQKIPQGYRTVAHVLYASFALATLYRYYVPPEKKTYLLICSPACLLSNNQQPPGYRAPHL